MKSKSITLTFIILLSLFTQYPQLTIANSGIETVTYTTKESAEQIQTLVVDDVDPEKVFKVEVNTGDAKILNKDNGVVEIGLNGGSPSKDEDTQYVEFTTDLDSEITRVALKAGRRPNTNMGENLNSLDLETAPGYSGYKGDLDRMYIGGEFKEVIYDAYSDHFDMKSYEYKNGEWVEIPSNYASLLTFDYIDEQGFSSYKSFSMSYTVEELVPKKEKIHYEEPVFFDGRKKLGQAGSHNLPRIPNEGDIAITAYFTSATRYHGLAFANNGASAKWKYTGEVHRPKLYQYEVTVYMDNSDPKINFNNIPNHTLNENEASTITAIITDEGSGINKVSCKLKNNTKNVEYDCNPQKNKSELDIEIPRDSGEYTIQVISVDNVGNETNESFKVAREGSLQLIVGDDINFGDVSIDVTKEQVVTGDTTISIKDTRIKNDWDLNLKYDGFKTTKGEELFGDLTVIADDNSVELSDAYQTITKGSADKDLELTFDLKIPKSIKVGKYNATLMFEVYLGP